MKKTVFHYTEEFLRRYIVDVYEKDCNDEWILLPWQQIDTDKGLYDVVNGQIGFWTNYRKEKFMPLNMDFDSLKCHRCYKINRTYQQDYFVVSNEKILEFMMGDNYYYIQKQTYSKGVHKCAYTINNQFGDFCVNDFSYTKKGIMDRFNKWFKKHAVIIR